MIIFCAIALNAAVLEDMNDSNNISSKDIKILKNELKRNPKDLAILNRLIKMSFVFEDFNTTVKAASDYLKIKKNKKIAYMKIVSLANQGSYNKASNEINKYLNVYDTTIDERTLIVEKQKLYLRSKNFKRNNSYIKNIPWGSNKRCIGVDQRKNILIGYDVAKNKLFRFNANRNKITYIHGELDYLSDLDIESIEYFSIAPDGRAVVASYKRGDYYSEILYRDYDSEDKEWNRWDYYSSLNPGNRNRFPNFISGSIIFTSDDRSKSGFDIYIALKEGEDSWATPRAVEVLNTKLDEVSVFVHPDRETLFFSSNGRPGFGGFDIYGTKIDMENGNFKTGKILNVTEVNTFRNEVDPVYFSNNSLTGFHNFYKAGMSSICKVKKFPFAPKTIVILDGYVYDKKSKLPMENANINLLQVIDNKKVDQNTYSDGYFGMVLKANRKYILSVSFPGYITSSTVIEPRGGVSVYREKFYITKGKIKKGYKFTAKKIHFDFGKASIKKKSYAGLLNIYNFLNSNKKIIVQISGHTDDLGSEAFNKHLSLQRAKAIKRYLEDKGINSQRLKAKGYGKSKIISKRISKAVRKEYRKVVITVLGNVKD